MINSVKKYPVTIRVENEFGNSDSRDLVIKTVEPTLGWKAKYDYLDQIQAVDYPYLTADMGETVSLNISCYLYNKPPNPISYAPTVTLRLYDKDNVQLYSLSRVGTSLNYYTSGRTITITGYLVPKSVLYKARKVSFGASLSYLYYFYNQILINPVTGTILNTGWPTSGALQYVIHNLKTTVNTNLISSLNYYQIFSNEGKIYYMNFDDTNMFTSQSYTKSLTSVVHDENSIYESSLSGLKKLSVSPQLVEVYSEDFETPATDSGLVLSISEKLLMLSTPTFTKLFDTLSMSELLLIPTGTEFGDISYDDTMMSVGSFDEQNTGGVYATTGGQQLFSISKTKYSCFYRDASKVVFCIDEDNELNNSIKIYNCSDWSLHDSINFPYKVNTCKVDYSNNFLLIGTTSEVKPIAVFNLFDLTEVVFYNDEANLLISPSRNMQLLPR